MENPGIRLDQLIKSMKLSRLRFAQETEIAQSFLNEIVNGKKNISRNSLQKIRNRYPLVNIDWLLTGDGTMYKVDTGVVHEPQNPYIKKYMKNVLEPDDKPIRQQLSANIARLISAWGMKKNEFFPLLIPGVQKQTVTNYLAGSSQPPLFALIHLERITNISLVDWLTHDIPAAQMPDGPQDPAAAIRAGGDIGALVAEIKTVLERYGG